MGDDVYNNGQYVERMNEDRQFWKFVIFGLLTFGIYNIFYEYCLTDDINTVCKPVETDDRDKSMNYILVLLLGIITLSIYFLYWIYKQGTRLKKAGGQYGVDIEESGGTYLLWAIIGVAVFGVAPFLLWFSFSLAWLSFLLVWFGSLLIQLGPCIMWYLFTKNTNKLAKAYNYRYVDRIQERFGNGSGTPPLHLMPIAAPSGDSPTGLLAAKGELNFLQGEYRGQVISLYPSNSLILGRNSQTSQLIFTNPNISRTHCEVRFSPQENTFYVTDYSSRGTWMNGSIKLQKGVRQKCPAGTRITLSDDGQNEFLLQ